MTYLKCLRSYGKSKLVECDSCTINVIVREKKNEIHGGR
jgi:hypothetical protein